LGIELVGIGLPLRATAERQFLRRRVGEIDDVGGLEVDLQPVDAARELLGDVVALVRTGGGGEGDKAGDCGGKQNRAGDVQVQCHDEKALGVHSSVGGTEAQGVQPGMVVQGQ